VQQMDVNGDQRISHDEFVAFFARLLMGSFDQRLLIAFKCFDVEGDECISKEEILMVLQSVQSS